MLRLTLPANLGRTKSKGYEVSLKVNEPLSEFATLWANLNYTHNTSTVIFRDDPELLPSYQKDAGYYIGQNRGDYPYGYMNDWDEVYASTLGTINEKRLPGDKKVIDYNADGIINVHDNVPWGYPNYPLNTWNASFGFNFKGWSFSVQLYGVFNMNINVDLPAFVYQ